MLYVSDEARLSEAVRRRLAEWSSAAMVPTRVLFGRYQNFTPGAWTEEESSACGLSVEECESRGVTLTVWGSATDHYGQEMNQLPGAFYTDGVARNLEIREVMVRQEGALDQAMALEHGGFTWGEFSERKVWSYLYLAHLPDDDKLNLDFLTDALTRSLDPSEFAAFREEAAQRAARAFARLMQGNPELRMREARARIDEEAQQIASWEQQIITTRQRLELRQREFDQIIASMAAPEEHWMREWELLQSHPKIVPGTLSVTDRKLQFDTVMLNIEDSSNGTELPLGRFRVTVGLEDYAVKLQNLNNRRGERDHPHVSRGNPCWGGYQAEVEKHIRDNEISTLVEFLFGYLQTYNERDDWGRYIRLWREQPEVVTA